MSAPKPTQEFVPIKEIRNGVVILKDGSMRAALIVSSINFALKSEDVQQAIILQFQNFLNSLDFSVQIFVQSRRLDIRPYLALLEERQKAQTTELMKVQTREYIEFIKSFTEATHIMSKSFFVVVPFAPALVQSRGGILSGLGTIAAKNPFREKNKPAKSEAETFEEYRTQLEQRLSVVEQGLNRSGLRTVQLGTEELLELFYKTLNPGETEKPMQRE